VLDRFADESSEQRTQLGDARNEQLNQPSIFMTDDKEFPDSMNGESRAYEEGWTAYQRDLDRSDNPYNAPREPTAFKDWIRGWEDAMAEAEEVER
jgi:hypothetical protein